MPDEHEFGTEFLYIARHINADGHDYTIFLLQGLTMRDATLALINNYWPK